MVISGLSIRGIIDAANSKHITTITQGPTTTPKTSTITETPIPKWIELEGILNINHGFEILGKYNLIAYTRVRRTCVSEVLILSEFMAEILYVFAELWHIPTTMHQSMNGLRILFRMIIIGRKYKVQ